MKVAIPTNNERTVANHIGVCKKIAIYEDGKLLEIIENPALKEAKEKNIPLGNEGERHLGTSSLIPELLSKKGVNVFIAREFRSLKFEQRLLCFYITPYVTSEKEIETTLKNINKEDIMQNETTPFGQGRGMGRKMRCGQGRQSGQNKGNNRGIGQGAGGGRKGLGRGMGQERLS